MTAEMAAAHTPRLILSCLVQAWAMAAREPGRAGYLPVCGKEDELYEATEVQRADVDHAPSSPKFAPDPVGELAALVGGHAPDGD